ncbi:AAA family ATPase [Paenibacillus nasutitermitis]|uniref:Adenylate kinase n=1 Tax=Paenibacillus nasutitermitis TaxID=1652958 RepID=A0A917DWE8_9BACL|nr:AAA family ATPase [Paenibacillus nasutitermitis]GGD77932.1 hypothetical protein GCM10010911_39900 [Paenibacillus nasutitermitis]
MINRIHIFGASGSGATTLGKELAGHLPHVNVDGDDYFWIEKFNQMRQPQERVKLLQADLAPYKQWILSGAVCGWGDELKPLFDFVIFLYVPQDIRLQRLREREYARYGEEIMPGGQKYEQSKAFLEWAALYDKAGLEVRSRTLHEQWIAGLACPVLRIEGDQTVNERVQMILLALAELERTKEAAQD